MNLIINRLRALVRKSEGQDMLEYALLVALIALIAYVGVSAAGGSVNEAFNTVAGKIDTAMQP